MKTKTSMIKNLGSVALLLTLQNTEVTQAIQSEQAITSVE